jgi:alkyl hydroperoxide reductase subunit AhpF
MEKMKCSACDAQGDELAGNTTFCPHCYSPLFAVGAKTVDGGTVTGFELGLDAVMPRAVVEYAGAVTKRVPVWSIELAQ